MSNPDNSNTQNIQQNISIEIYAVILSSSRWQKIESVHIVVDEYKF